VLLEEDENRLLQLAPDKSREQTRRVIERIAKDETDPTADDASRQTIRRKHETAQRLLKTYEVRVPFAPLLAVPSDKVTARRAFGQLIGCIKAVALLRQYQKKARNGVIVATPKDYEIAFEIMFPVLQRTFAAINEKALHLYDLILTRSKEFDFKFNRRNCVAWSGLSDTEVRNRLAILVDSELILQSDDAKPGRRIWYQIANPASDPRLSLKGMVSPATLRKKMNQLDAQKATTETESLASGSWDGAPIADSDDEE
jgi:hypothetical protein